MRCIVNSIQLHFALVRAIRLNSLPPQCSRQQHRYMFQIPRIGVFGLLVMLLIACGGPQQVVQTTPVTADLKTPFAIVEPTSSPLISTAMPASAQNSLTPTSLLTAISPPPSTVSVTELAVTENAAVPTSNSTNSGVPVVAPRRLSNLRTEVQEQLLWTAGGGAAGGISSNCLNHPGIDDLTGEIVREPIDQRLVVDNAVGIGQTTMFCIDPPQELQPTDKLQIEILRPDGSWERLSFLYGAFTGYPEAEKIGPDAQRLTITNSLGGVRYVQSENSHQGDDPYIQTQDNITYIFQRGAMLGTYKISLIIDDKPLATQPLDVQLCDCPRVAVSGGRPSNDIADEFMLRRDSIIGLSFTGFAPNETVKLELQKETKIGDTGSWSTPYYQWQIQLDQRGEGVEELVIDTDVPNGHYFLLRSDTTTAQSHGCGIGDKHESVAAQLCDGRSGISLLNIGIPQDRLTELAQAIASSTLPPEDLSAQGKGIFRYDAQNVLDGNRGQPWIEGIPGHGIGQRIDLTFTKPVTLTELDVSIGFDLSDKNFQDNNRVRQATLIFSDGSTQQVTFPDERGLHVVPIVDKRTTSLGFVIDEIYPGERFDDTAVGEIEVWGNNGDK